MSWPSIKISNEINPSEIDNMEYIENTYFMRDEPPTCIRKVLFPKNGEITKSIDEESSVVKIVTESEMHDFFEFIANFLTTCNLGFERFIDDSEGSLFIHYNDGHIEEYDRGLTKNGISLLSIIRHYTQDNDI